MLGIKLSFLALSEGLKSAYLPGRCEWLSFQNKSVLFDVAHNPHSITSLAKTLSTLDNPVKMVFSMFKDKDISLSVDLLAPYVERWYVAELAGDRTARLNDYKMLFETKKIKLVSYFSCLGGAFKEALDELPLNQVLVVSGSFNTVAALHPLSET